MLRHDKQSFRLRNYDRIRFTLDAFWKVISAYQVLGKMSSANTKMDKKQIKRDSGTPHAFVLVLNSLK